MFLLSSPKKQTEKEAYVQEFYPRIRYPADYHWSNVDTKNERTHWEGLLVTYWAQIYKQSLVTIAKQGLLTQVLFQGEACTELPACNVFLLSEQTLMKDFLESFFNE